MGSIDGLELEIPVCNNFFDLDGYDIDEDWFNRHQSSPTGNKRSCNDSNNQNGATTSSFPVKCDTQTTKDPSSQRGKENRRKSMRNFKVQSSGIKRATVPKTPCLRSMTRNRMRTVDTPNTRERKLLSQMEKEKFKASKVPTKIFVEPQPIILEHKHTTRFNEPSVLKHTKKSRPAQDDSHHVSFHAQPVPDYSELGKIGINRHPQPTCTVPKTPNIQKNGTRRKVLKEQNLDNVAKPQTFYHPPPKFTSPFRPAPSNKITEPRPFSFESRQVPKHRPVEDRTSSDDCGGSFKARPVPKIVPFKPHPAEVPPTKPIEALVPHALDSRLHERKHIEEERTKRRERDEKMHQERLAREKEEEMKSIRQQTMFKAQPIRSYRRLSIKHVVKYTKAQSPHFVSGKNAKKKKSDASAHSSND